MGREDQGLAHSRARYCIVPRTLCFIRRADCVLLLRGGSHKRLWAGRYNGVGGHVEPGEDIHSAVIREVFEETGLAVHDLHLCGVVHVDASDPTLGVLIFIFTAATDQAKPPASPDGVLDWFPMDTLPTADMVEDLPTLLPRVLGMGPDDAPFFALSRYDAHGRLVVTFSGEP